MEILTLNITTGKIEKSVTFRVLNIITSFNMLLKFPWIHDLGVILSSLHLKVKKIVKGVHMALEASPVSIHVIAI